MCASPFDLIDGEARKAIAWDPSKCESSRAHDRMEELFSESTRSSNLTEASEAAWQYFTGGPRAVRKWSNLESIFKEKTRRELGLTLFEPDTIRLWMVDESSSEDYGSNEDESSEEVSYGPIDVWIDAKK
jgi:hypothetical protein